MNERIRELAEQAGFIGENMYPIFGTCQETALKNFAELIVRECSDLFDIEWGLCELTGHDASKVILKHFGVK